MCKLLSRTEAEREGSIIRDRIARKAERIKMKSSKEWQIRLVQILLGGVIVLALVLVRGTRAGDEPVHLTTDWSHRHLIFSPPHNLG
jgi:hypothetical protein